MKKLSLNEELRTVDYNMLKEKLMDRVEISEYLTEVANEFDIGINNKIRCPLPDHDDSTPSFFFDDGKQVFKCFGCGKGGTVVELHQIMSNKSKREAIEDLCRIYQIELSIIANYKKQKVSKGKDFFDKLRTKSRDKKSVLQTKEEKILTMVEDYAQYIEEDKRVRIYQLSDKLYVSVGLLDTEKENMIKEIETIIKESKR